MWDIILEDTLHRHCEKHTHTHTHQCMELPEALTAFFL